MNRASTEFLIPKFLSVGSFGFLLDVVVFQLLYSLGQGHTAARITSAALAITLTWFLNRHFVFKTSTVNDKAREYVRYITIQALGLTVNLLVYFVLVDRFGIFQRSPILALCSGALAALIFNYVGARYYAFKHTG